MGLSSVAWCLGMDPVAHTLLGATLAEAGLKRLTRGATATLLIGANLPDIDFVAMFAGSDASLGLRRGHTHGVVAALVLPWLLALAVKLYYRVRDKSEDQPRFIPLIALSYIGVLSHPFLDWLNTYGVRLLMPLRERWFYGDALFIIEPWLWLILAAGVVVARSHSRRSIGGWCVLGGLTSSIVLLASGSWPVSVVWVVGVLLIVAIRVRKTNPVWAARGSLALAGFYIAMMLHGTHVSTERMNQWMDEQNFPGGLAMTGPIPGDPFTREAILVSSGKYQFFELNWLTGSAPVETDEPIALGDPSPILQAVRSAPQIQGRMRWLRFPAFEVLEKGSGFEVRVHDVRYSRRGSTIGTAIVELDKNLEPLP